MSRHPKFDFSKIQWKALSGFLITEVEKLEISKVTYMQVIMTCIKYQELKFT